MNRRTFIAAATGAAASLAAARPAQKIIDTHTHFYDPSRPQGVPWPRKNETVLYRTVLPPEYVRMTRALGIVGAIEVEASPLLEDNQWVLDLIPENPVIVGTVGHLEPGKPSFGESLERFHRNKLFRGIRLGKLPEGSPAPQFVADLRALMQAGLELDLIGSGETLLPTAIRITDLVPDLRVVLNHLPLDLPPEKTARERCEASMREIRKRPRIYAKVSNVPRKVNGVVPDDVDHYRPALDELWEVFGADRVVYGSNWPVSDLVAPFAVALKIVREYFTEKGAAASEKFFYGNSRAAYRW